MGRIKPCVWFDGQAEEAANFYVSIFGDSKITSVQRYGEAGPGLPGSVMLVEFVLEGQEFLALNGGPQYHFTEAVSFATDCETQEQVDELWARLTDGGEESQCGWLKDRYGLSWQVVPRTLGELLTDPDPAKSAAVMRAMLAMGKIEIQALRDAYDGA
jgi:predicted 3-demethylubiquinone-9 3-methyltransferase (glyoxalase superfamily)